MWIPYSQDGILQIRKTVLMQKAPYINNKQVCTFERQYIYFLCEVKSILYNSFIEIKFSKPLIEMFWSKIFNTT